MTLVYNEANLQFQGKLSSGTSVTNLFRRSSRLVYSPIRQPLQIFAKLSKKEAKQRKKQEEYVKETGFLDLTGVKGYLPKLQDESPIVYFREYRDGREFAVEMKRRFRTTKDKSGIIMVGSALESLTDYMNPSKRERLSTPPEHKKQVDAYMILTRLIPKLLYRLSKEEIMRSVNSLAVGGITIRKNVKHFKLYNIFNFIVINILERMEITLDPLEYVTLLTTAAYFEYEFADRVEKLLAFIKPHFFEFPTKVQRRIFWSIKRLRYYEEDFFTKVEEGTLDGRLQLDCEGISQALIMFGSLGLKDKRVLDTLVEQYLDVYEEIPNRIAAVIYNLALLKYPIKDLQILVNKTINQHPVEEWESQPQNFLLQLRKAQLYYEYAGDNLIYPLSLTLTARQSLRDYIRDSLKTKFEVAIEITRKLKRKFKDANVQQRQAIIDGEVKSEVLCSCYGKVINIVVQGPKAFSISKPEFLLNASKMEFEMIENAGWKVIMVDERLWKKEKMVYVKKVLVEVYYIFKEGVDPLIFNSTLKVGRDMDDDDLEDDDDDDVGDDEKEDERDSSNEEEVSEEEVDLNLDFD